MMIDKQFLIQHATQAGQSVVSAAQDVLDLRHGIQRAIATIADELTRRTTPARPLRAVAEAPAARIRRLASRRYM